MEDPDMVQALIEARESLAAEAALPQEAKDTHRKNLLKWLEP